MEIRRIIAAAISVAALFFFFAPSAAFANSQANQAINGGPDAAI
jgi:hypothetical protein